MFSIIIPTFNRAHTLPDTLNSVIKQSARNWEIIIVDDGSTDSTRKELEVYLSDERIKYFYQNNMGVSLARNKGVEQSRGDYLIFLDSDDKILPGLISRLDEIKCENYDLICWEVLKNIDGKTEVWKPKKLEKIYNNITAIFLAGSVCYKKEIFLQAGGFDPKMTFGENYELGMRISERKDLKIKILPQQFLYYVVNNNNRESDTLENKVNSYQNLYKKHRTKFRNDRKSHSQMLYFLGFVYEKLGMKLEAKEYFWYSFVINPLNYKALLKSIYFKLL
ncbi:MAG: glycosyltransferase family A protein [Salegentibacter mishustinae]|nr:glycosyltransferase family A protein [Salegentibacter mishustinae]